MNTLTTKITQRYLQHYRPPCPGQIPVGLKRPGTLASCHSRLHLQTKSTLATNTSNTAVCIRTSAPILWKKRIEPHKHIAHRRMCHRHDEHGETQLEHDDKTRAEERRPRPTAVTREARSEASAPRHAPHSAIATSPAMILAWRMQKAAPSAMGGAVISFRDTHNAVMNSTTTTATQTGPA